MDESRAFRPHKLENLLDNRMTFEPEHDEFKALQILDHQKHVLKLDSEAARKNRSFNRLSLMR